MTPEQLNSYQSSGSTDPRIYASALRKGNYTLTTGYNVNNEGYVHVYLMDDEIHLLVHDGKRILGHQCSDAMPAPALRPSKRAFPHTTDERFAYLMRDAGEPLTFLGNFNWDQDWVRTEMELKPFKTFTHLNLW